MGSHIFTAILLGLLALTLTTSAAERGKRQLPCNHPLRIARPQLFSHCGACQYSAWSKWREVANSAVSVSVGQCASGKAYTEERNRTATGSGCTGVLQETRNSTCVPHNCQYSSWSKWRRVRYSVVSVPFSQCARGRAYTRQRNRTATGSGCTEALHETQNNTCVRRRGTNTTNGVPHNCQYTSWRKVPNSVVSVPVNQCASGKAYAEERTPTAAVSGCIGAPRETKRICLPTQEERLIIGLGLGGSGNNYKPLANTNKPIANKPLPNTPLSNSNVNIPQVASITTYSSRTAFTAPTLNHTKPTSNLTTPKPTEIPPGPKCPQYGTNGPICSTRPNEYPFSIPRLGKRSVKSSNKRRPSEEVVHADLNPIPFDWLEHGPRLRNKRQASCGDQDMQSVLFVLDTSGSIGHAQFARMKKAISQLPALFCKQVQFAAVTFNQYINLEFCFDCFNNSYQGRSEVSAAINDIKYRGGLTHTAATARCICQEILHPSCGIKALPDCLDVVFITDGKSNDPGLQICDEIGCLHRRSGVDTYAIGINGYDLDELECITNYSDLTSAFEFESFTAFERAIENIIERLVTALPDSPESCARLDSTISPTGASSHKTK